MSVDIIVKEEPIWDRDESEASQSGDSNLAAVAAPGDSNKGQTGDRGLIVTAEQAGLYFNHIVKHELVVGPEILQPPDVVFALKGKAGVKSEPKLIEDCKIKTGNIKVKKQEYCADDYEKKSLILENDFKFKFNELKKEASNENLEVPKTDDFKGDHFTCQKCKFMFSTKLCLLKHKKTKHGIAFFSCNKCNYVAGRKSHLQNHLLTHTRVKAFKCNYCDYKCSRKDSLSVHKRVHDDERIKLLQCQYCSYRCDSKLSLNLHEMIHKGLKPFKCQQCVIFKVCKVMSRLIL